MLFPKLRSARMGFSEVLQLRCKLRYWLLVMWCGRCAVFVWLFPVRPSFFCFDGGIKKSENVADTEKFA